MTLHPDVLTDLVIQYPAGEASEASRKLLEGEATRNPRVAAALATPPRTMPPLAVDPPDVQRRAIQDVHRTFRRKLLLAGLSVALLLLAFFLFPPLH